MLQYRYKRKEKELFKVLLKKIKKGEGRMKNLEEEFANKERIWERIKIERSDLSGLWVENVKDAINELPIDLQKSILMSIASYALRGGTHGYPSPGALLSTWLQNPSYKGKFSMRELESLLKLKHYSKVI